MEVLIYEDGVKRRKPIRYIITESGCHECVSHVRNYFGYTMIRIEGKLERLHRYAYTRSHGKIPKDMVVMHTCDNPHCFNVAHLKLGTVLDNNQDMIDKGRYSKGEDHYITKLTEAEVRAIRKDPRTHREIGADYNIDGSMVSYIKSRKKWAWLED